ncbi:hypothetical protein TSMEX_004235 [Taenia solium]|eukprot:TsM_000632800 transcript=TsM_000632800 gene=TsM_000632800
MGIDAVLIVELRSIKLDYYAKFGTTSLGKEPFSTMSRPVLPKILTKANPL